jgi:peptidoglycan/LPS O-acetylase OafA/YrhL
MDGLRGYAVLLVFCVHQFGYAAQFVGRDLTAKTSGFDAVDLVLLWLINSNYGVYLFFALSGFLIGRMLLAAKPPTYWTFIARRFARIYPAFLLSLLAGAIVTIFITKRVGFSWTVLAQNLVFLNGWFAIGEVPSYNFVTWSLFFEFVFYLTIPAIALLPAAPAWRIIGGLAIMATTAIVMQLGPAYLFFFAGYLVANASDARLRQIAARIPIPILLVGYLLTTSLYAFRILSETAFTFLYMVVATGIIVSAAFGTGLFNKICLLKPLRALGTISYSFYLLHALVAICVFMVCWRYAPPEAWQRWIVVFAATPISLGLSIAAATVLYWIAERPYFMGMTRYRAWISPTKLWQPASSLPLPPESRQS